MSDNFVPVNVTKRFNPTDRLGTQHVTFAPQDGTLADLRLVLAEDNFMADSDSFLVNDRTVGKSSEKRMKWSTAVKVGIRRRSQTI